MDKIIVNEFPKLKLPASKKGEEYTLAWGEAILSFDRNNTNDFLNNSTRELFDELRSYGAGNQSKEKYKDVYTTKNDQTRKRKGYSNIDESIVPYAPKVKHGVMKMIDSGGSSLNVSFLDSASIDEKEREKTKSIVASKYKNQMAQVSAMSGVEMEQPKVVAADEEELMAFEEAGMFKLNKEIALEMGLNYVFDYDNRWDMEVGFELKENFIDIGIAGLFPYIDPQENTVKFRRINPSELIVDYSDYVDYRDAKFIGEIISVPYSELIVDYKETTGKEITEDELKEIRNINNENIYVSKFSASTSFYDVPKEGKNNEDGFFVRVLDFMYESIDVVKKPTTRTKRVKLNPEKVKESELTSGKVYKDGDDYYKDIADGGTIDVRQWRRGKLIIGTRCVYDYGLVYNQVRDKNFDPQPPFILERLRTKSIMEIIKPNLDALQIDMLKLQVLKSKASGKGLAINVDSIQNLTLGGEMYNPKDILKMKELTGNYFYKLKAAGLPDQFNMGSQAAPFQEIEGSMGNFFKELLMDIDFNMRMIQDNTGLSDIALAQTPNSEMGLGLNQMSLTASENIISNITYAYKNIKEKAAYIASLHLLQLAKREKNHPIYSKAIGETNWKELGKQQVDSVKNLGIKINSMPNQDEIRFMMEIINRGMQTGRNGEPSITGDEAFNLYSMIKEGKPLSYVNLVQRKLREGRERKAEEMKNTMIEAQGAQNQQATQAAMAAEAQLKEQDFQMNFKGEMEKMIKEYDLKLRNDLQIKGFDSQEKEADRQVKRDDGSLKYMLEQMKINENKQRL